MEAVRSALSCVQPPSLDQIRSGDYWRSFFRRQGGNIVAGGGGGNSRGADFFATFEGRLVALQEVLIWTDPIRSVVWLVLAQGVLYQFCLSTTPLLSSAAYMWLVAYLYHTWTARIWPTISLPPEHPQDTEAWTPMHPDTLSAPELEKITHKMGSRMKEIYSGLWLLRAERPLVFCILMSSAFTALALLGCRLSTPMLIHGSCLLAFLLPTLLMRLSRNETAGPVVAFSAEILSSLSSLLVYRGKAALPQEHHDLDDFMPDETPETLRSLEVQEKFQGFSPSEPEDSLSESLVSGLRIPSLEEVAAAELLDSPASQDLELDLLPTNRPIQDMPETDSESEEEGVGAPLGQIRGVEDSSDSDSDLMPQLRVRETRSVTSRLTAVSSSVTSMLPSMTSVLGSLVTRRESSEPELEDFEMISEDDLDREMPDL